MCVYDLFLFCSLVTAFLFFIRTHAAQSLFQFEFAQREKTVFVGSFLSVAYIYLVNQTRRPDGGNWEEGVCNQRLES